VAVTVAVMMQMPVFYPLPWYPSVVMAMVPVMSDAACSQPAALQLKTAQKWLVQKRSVEIQTTSESKFPSIHSRITRTLISNANLA
jgi:hypothetical protein